MRTISREQSHELMAKLATNMDWSLLSPELAQEIIRDPVRSGKEFTRFLRNGAQITSLSIDGVLVPMGARIYTLQVLVDESLQWHSAVAGAGPDTSGHEHVWSVGGQYPATVSMAQRSYFVGDLVLPWPEPVNVLLINFRRRIHSAEAVAWGAAHNLVPLTPRTCFVIGKQFPGLDADLGGRERQAVILSVTPCILHEGYQWIPMMWWNKTMQGAGLLEFDYVWEGDKNYWFGFTPIG